MDNRKFEQLIDLIINENEEQARALFHDIVVEKSREIYESMMDEEGEGMGGQVGDMMDEIRADQSGVLEDEEESDVLDIEDGADDEVLDLDTTDEEDFGGEEEKEDTLVRIEDKLDQLMAEFEDIMGDDDAEVADFDAEEEFGGDEGGDEFAAGEEEEALAEAINLKQVPGLYGSKIGGDNGVQTKSTVTANSGARGMASKPVSFSGDTESAPTSPKGPSNAYSKGETQVKDASNWKNAPAGDAGKTSFKEKVPGGFGHKTPQGKEVGAGGSVAQNDKSVVESRRTTKRRI